MPIRCAHCRVDRSPGSHPCWNCGASGGHVEPDPEVADYLAALQREATTYFETEHGCGLLTVRLDAARARPGDPVTPAPAPPPAPSAPSPPPPETHSDPVD